MTNVVNHEQGGRMPYKTPTLTTYGDIRTITLAGGNTGNLDGAAFGAKSTLKL